MPLGIKKRGIAGASKRQSDGSHENMRSLQPSHATGPVRKPTVSLDDQKLLLARNNNVGSTDAREPANTLPNVSLWRHAIAVVAIILGHLVAYRLP